MRMEFLIHRCSNESSKNRLIKLYLTSHSSRIMFSNNYWRNSFLFSRDGFRQYNNNKKLKSRNFRKKNSNDDTKK